MLQEGPSKPSRRAPPRSRPVPPRHRPPPSRGGYIPSASDPFPASSSTRRHPATATAIPRCPPRPHPPSSFASSSSNASSGGSPARSPTRSTPARILPRDSLPSPRRSSHRRGSAHSASVTSKYTCFAFTGSQRVDETARTHGPLVEERLLHLRRARRFQQSYRRYRRVHEALPPDFRSGRVVGEILPETRDLAPRGPSRIGLAEEIPQVAHPTSGRLSPTSAASTGTWCSKRRVPPRLRVANRRDLRFAVVASDIGIRRSTTVVDIAQI